MGNTIFTLIYLVVVVLELAAMWQLFAKAGEAGWQAIIPVWNTIVLLKIAGRPAWWFILYLIPVVNIVFYFIVMIDLAHSYGKGTGFGVFLAILPWIAVPMLAFGDASYRGQAVMAPSF